LSVCRKGAKEGKLRRRGDTVTGSIDGMEVSSARSVRGVTGDMKKGERG